MSFQTETTGQVQIDARLSPLLSRSSYGMAALLPRPQGQALALAAEVPHLHENHLQALHAAPLVAAPAAFGPVLTAALAHKVGKSQEVQQTSHMDTVLARALRVAEIEAKASGRITHLAEQMQLQSAAVAAATPNAPVAPPAPVTRPVAYVWPRSRIIPCSKVRLRSSVILPNLRIQLL